MNLDLAGESAPDRSLDNEEHWLSKHLRMLLQTFSCFMIIDRYEIMIELIKRELKTT
jgi:hypothetical protein